MLLNKLTTVIRWLFSLQIEKFSESEEVLRAFDDGSRGKAEGAAVRSVRSSGAVGAWY